MLRRAVAAGIARLVIFTSQSNSESNALRQRLATAVLTHTQTPTKKRTGLVISLI